MNLDKSFFDRETNIKVKVICDSISEQGIRLTTFEVEAPRIILAEINTHKAISKNCSSTRAITLNKAIEQVQDNGFEPLYFGKKKTGMSATEEIEFKEIAKSILLRAKDSAINHVKMLDESCELHKQITGRLLEPFQMVKQVLTATDWDNFFNLRIHKDSQPEICMLAYKMFKAMEESKPVELKAGQWHLPYCFVSYQGEYDLYSMFYYDEDVEHTCEHVMTLDEAIKYSAASCAAVSYRTEDMTLEKADKIFDMLIKAEVLHASPFEHIATPIVEVWDKTGDTFDVFINKSKSKNVPRFMDTWQEGVTHMNKQGQLCSGNLRGFIQYRHLLPNNTNWNFDFEKRMKMFG